MFRSNEAFKVSVDKGPGELINTIENINTFFTNVPEAREHFWNVEMHCNSIYWYRLTNCSWTLFLTVNCFVSSCYGLFTVSAALLQSLCSFCVRCKQTSVLKSDHWLNTDSVFHIVNILIWSYKRLGKGWMENGAVCCSSLAKAAISQCNQSSLFVVLWTIS